MNDTVSDGAVTHFSQTVVQGDHVCKETLKRALKPKCHQTTVKTRTIDGVTKTTFYSERVIMLFFVFNLFFNVLS